MLFLFSEVGEDDAPTRVRIGSHLDVPSLLQPYGDDGVEFFELARKAVPATEHRPIAHATGQPGDVYLIHPFLVHSAQVHRGTRPKFMAQPPLMPTTELDVNGPSRVAEAIRLGLGRLA
jgi:phytanoyl-CoA dioxygenase PhyH